MGFFQKTPKIIFLKNKLNTRLCTLSNVINITKSGYSLGLSVKGDLLMLKDIELLA